MKYDFKCECGIEFEVEESMKDTKSTHKCECGKMAQKVISASPIMFKGGGWTSPPDHIKIDTLNGKKRKRRKTKE